jgi:hypothetical protein
MKQLLAFLFGSVIVWVFVIAAHRDLVMMYRKDFGRSLAQVSAFGIIGMAAIAVAIWH